ncbi:MAG: hypothetical protein KKB32_05000 [Acidobacteria bacterium]|nr:hypothetical protein [Acidobacteriota bacterium]
MKGAVSIENPAKFQFLQTFCGNCPQPVVFFAYFPVFKQKKQIMVPIPGQEWRMWMTHHSCIKNTQLNAKLLPVFSLMEVPPDGLEPLPAVFWFILILWHE